MRRAAVSGPGLLFPTFDAGLIALAAVLAAIGGSAAPSWPTLAKAAVP